MKRKTEDQPEKRSKYASKLLGFDISNELCIHFLKRSFGQQDCLPSLGLAVLNQQDDNPTPLVKLDNPPSIGMSSSGASSSSKGRSPLAIVSNQGNSSNIVQNSTGPVAQLPTMASVGLQDPVNLRKYYSIVNDERFFLYRKRSTKHNTGEDFFSRLSDEMILQIFRWLPKKALLRCSQVSKRLNRVSRDETLWTRLDLSCKALREGALGHVLNRGTVILRLAQAHVTDPIFLPCNVEPTFESKVQFLDLSMCSIDRQTLQELLSCCRSLRKLSLENVPIDGGCCQEIADNENLEALNLTMAEGLDAFSLTLLLKKLTKLHSLNISWTSLSRQAVEAVVNHVTPNLLRLNIAGCRSTLTDAALDKLIVRCPGLLELDLSDCTQLTSECIGMVCKLRKLEYLSLSRCYNIHVTAYLQLSELHSLLFLDVFGLLSEQAIVMLQTSFPGVGINKFMHSSVARPTVGTRRTSIWGLRTRD
ncbi:S-phase kinase-associated protein 2 isoform X2 [Uranotaenia lowii]|uniref:S-phase kinase-associated protein 2 isoform X2 n=1 Tax=Uranotaenia lowii TaxID=190385 RepID=UPI002479C0CA|nr:S-phase kinase-associated protein 2 isoform X2 [Uranotaenia lowii]